MSQAACVAWIPCNPDLNRNRLFELTAARDNALERFTKVHQLFVEQGFDSHTVDLCNLERTEILIFYGLASELRFLLKAIKSNPKIRLINIPIEPPVISPLHEPSILASMAFDRILVWNDEAVKMGLPFIKANIGEPRISTDAIPYVSFENKGFISAIYSSKLVRHENGLYEERLRAFRYFSGKPEGFDLYGVGWAGNREASISSSYKGPCESKMGVLKNYKFSICFENARNYPGLITEKIFDCFAAGTVPIYLGAPNISDYIPKACFIDFRDFRDYEDLYIFLRSMKVEQYQGYLEAVKDFLNSPAYFEFTSDRYAQILLSQVQSLLSEPPPVRTVLGFKLSLLKVVIRHPLFIVKNFRRCRRFLFDLLFAF